MRKVTMGNYQDDPHYPRVARAVHAILERTDYVAPVELFQEMGLLTRKDYEDWRMARVPYLERVIRCNLSKASRILHILARIGADQGLKASHTDYRKWGRGGNTRLRFSKSGDPNLEVAWSRHFCRGKRKDRLPPGDSAEISCKPVSECERSEDVESMGMGAR